MAIPFLQFSSKKQASDWCHGGVVIVYVYLLWGQPARGLRFWGILGYNGIASTLNLPSHQNFSVWSSLVKPLRACPTLTTPDFLINKLICGEWQTNEPWSRDSALGPHLHKLPPPSSLSPARGTIRKA